jgi:hypothetical protein
MRILAGLALSNDILKIFTSDRAVVSTLFQTYAENLSRFRDLRFIGRVNLNHRILALFLFLQNFECCGVIGGGNHASRIPPG